MVIMILSIGTYVHVHVLSSEIKKYQKQARALVEDLETKTSFHFIYLLIHSSLNPLIHLYMYPLINLFVHSYNSE